MPLETLITFFTVSLLLALSPGPDNIFVLTQSVLYGRRAGLIITLGLCTGLIVHTTIVTVGIAALILSMPLAFNALRIFGALYLIYLAWLAFSDQSRANNGNEYPQLTNTQLYQRGIIMNLSNPKVLLFFLALLPQFVDPAIGPVFIQMSVLGGLFILATLLIFGSVAIVAGKAGQWMKTSLAAHQWMHRIAGTIFLLLATRLLFI